MWGNGIIMSSLWANVAFVLLYFGWIAVAQEIVNKVVVTGRVVTLSCEADIDIPQVIWASRREAREPFPTSLFTCNLTGSTCELFDPVDGNLYSADVRGLESDLSIMVSNDISRFYYCFSNPITPLASFELKFIDPAEIQPPNCSVSATFESNVPSYDLRQVLFICKSTTVRGIEADLEIFTPGQNNSELGSHVQEIMIDYDIFRINSNASCKSSFHGLDVHQTCVFPSYADVYQHMAGNSVEFECQSSRSVSTGDPKVTWRMMDHNGEDVNIANRSWTRNQGSSMLLMNVNEQDVGRIIECKIYSSNNASLGNAVGFAIINDIHMAPATPSKTIERAMSTTVTTPVENRDQELYMRLTILFIVLEVLSLAFIVACTIRTKLHQDRGTDGQTVKNKATQEMQKMSRDGIASPDVERNENNSALENSSERHTMGGREGDVQPRCSQVETSGIDNPFYFCVDRSTPSVPRSFIGTEEMKSDNEDEDDMVCDDSGYDLVQIPVRTSVVDVKNRINVNKEVCAVDRNVNNTEKRSIEDTSKLYSKVMK